MRLEAHESAEETLDQAEKFVRAEPIRVVAALLAGLNTCRPSTRDHVIEEAAKAFGGDDEFTAALLRVIAEGISPAVPS